MKRTDDYSAKLEIWAHEAKVLPLPVIRGLPRIGSKKFSSYGEFNAWKRSLIMQLAQNGGARWTR